MERHFFGENLPYEGDSTAIRLREASTVYAEVEQTAADIRRLLAAGKCRCRDITVAARNMTEYAGTIETVFERYGIPVYLSRRSDILEKPVLSLLTGVLSSISNGYEYEDMFRWLKTGLAGLTAEECDLLENYVLKWDIHGQAWLRDEDWTENPDGYGAPWNDRRQAVLMQVNQLRRRVREPLERLAAGLKAGETARDYVEALYGFMEELKLETALTERMHAQAEAGPDAGGGGDGPALGDPLRCAGSVCGNFRGRTLGTERVRAAVPPGANPVQRGYHPGVFGPGVRHRDHPE